MQKEAARECVWGWLHFYAFLGLGFEPGNSSTQDHELAGSYSWVPPYPHLLVRPCGYDITFSSSSRGNAISQQQIF